jgi:glycerol-3-phosphate cytidylyltransferase
MFEHALTIGTFDTPHLGHAILVARCHELAERVTVGVNSDKFVERYKGVKPLYSEDERMELMEQLNVDVVLNTSDGYRLISEVKPDVIVIGSDWLGRDYLKQIGMTADDFNAWGIALIYVPHTDGISTTDLRERLANEQEAHRD